MRDVEIQGAAGFLPQMVSEPFNPLVVVYGSKRHVQFCRSVIEGSVPAGTLIRDYAAKLLFPVIPDLLPNSISRAYGRPPGFYSSYF